MKSRPKCGAAPGVVCRSIHCAADRPGLQPALQSGGLSKAYGASALADGCQKASPNPNLEGGPQRGDAFVGIGEVLVRVTAQELAQFDDAELGRLVRRRVTDLAFGNRGAATQRAVASAQLGAHRSVFDPL